MTLVVDASVAVRWLLDLEHADRSDAILRSGDELVAPDLVIPELSNAVWKSVQFATTTVDAAAAAIGRAGQFFDEIVPSMALKDRALQIAVELRHPAYDCFYLALAELRDCQLITSDERLIAQCAQTPFAKRVRPLVSVRSGRRR
jgi:predicted nucleic acid-binding protein